MTTIHKRFEAASYDERAAFLLACRDRLDWYMEFVHDWRPRPHQRSWVEALEALVIPPPCYNGAGPTLTGSEALAEAGASCYNGAEPNLATWVSSEAPSHDGASCFLCRVHRERRLLIVAFPGSGKTDTAAIEFLCWAIGRDPEKAAHAIFCYNDTIATDRSVAVRDTVWAKEPVEVNERYAMVFPGIGPAKGAERPWGQDRWFLARRNPTKKDPTVIACGLEGSVVARRLNGGVIDDPHSGSDAQSPHERRKVVRNWKQAVRTRFTQDAWQVCITPRWSSTEDAPDMAGFLMGLRWPTIETRALDDYDESTWPYEGEDRGYSTEFLRAKREEAPREFMLNYQLVTVAEEGAEQLGTPKQVWPSQIPLSFAVIVQSWDTAAKPGVDRSETACATMAKGHDGRPYLLDVYAEQPRETELDNLVLAKFDAVERERRRPDRVLIEEKSSGSGLCARLRKYTPLPIKGISPGGRGLTKENRVRTVCRNIEELVMPADASWKGKVLAQIANWPYPGRDDVLMAIVQGLEYLFPLAARGAPPELEVRYHAGR